MNLTISSPSVNTWKHVKAQYIAAVCGIALAISAVVIATSWHSSSMPVTLAVDTSVAPSEYSKPSARVLFVVGSEAEAARVEGWLSADSYIPAESIRAEITVVNTLEQELSFVETLKEMVLLGTPFLVSDLRLPAFTAAVSASIERPLSSAQVEAAVMASVISTERAAWVFDDAASAGADPYANEAIDEHAVREVAQVGLTTR